MSSVNNIFSSVLNKNTSDAKILLVFRRKQLVCTVDKNVYSSVASNSLKHEERGLEKDALRIFPEIPGYKGEHSLYHILLFLISMKNGS